MGDKLEGAEALAPFNPSGKSVIEEIAKVVTSKDVVYDLGCGDGRLVLDLADQVGCRCVGVEYDKRYYDRALDELNRRGLKELVSIRLMDICQVEDLDKATVVYMYLSVTSNEKLQQLVLRAFNSGARVLTYMFSFPVLGEPSKVMLCKGNTKLFVYEKSHDSVENQEKDGKEDSGEEENDLLVVLKRLFDPIKNPWIMRIFNISLVALILLLAVMIYVGIDNIHIYNMLALAIALFGTMNWFFKEILKEIEKQNKKQD